LNTENYNGKLGTVQCTDRNDKQITNEENTLTIYYVNRDRDLLGVYDYKNHIAVIIINYVLAKGSDKVQYFVQANGFESRKNFIYGFIKTKELEVE